MEEDEFKKESLDFEARKEYSEVDEYQDSEELPDDYNYSLNSFGIDFTVSGLVGKLINEEIKVPEFQRNYVWNAPRASRFIESLLLGLPVPGLFLHSDEKEFYWVVDGMQRLHALRSFYEGSDDNSKALKLTGVKESLKGKTYKTLSGEQRRKLDNSIIHCTIIKPNDPKNHNRKSVFLIFERLNTGGVVLTHQEIRNCVYDGGLLKTINMMADKKYFTEFLSIKTIRKKHQEICLRLLCLAENWEKYSTNNMKRFLNDCLDPNEKEFSLNPLDDKFEKTIKFIKTNLSKTIKSTNKNQINLPLLDAIFVGIYNNYNKIEKLDIKTFVEEIEKIIDSGEMKEHTKAGTTHNPNSMKGRIKLVNDLVKKSCKSQAKG